jgi:hypothetical protein
MLAAEDNAQSGRVEVSPCDFDQAKRLASRAVNGNWKMGRKVSPAFVAMLVCLGSYLSDRPGHLDRSGQVKLAGRKPRTVSSTDRSGATVGAHNENEKKLE